MRRLLVALALLHVAGIEVAAAGDDDCGTCCKLERKKDRALREQRRNDALCMSTGDVDACDLALEYSQRYQDLSAEYEEKCVPKLRAE